MATIILITIGVLALIGLMVALIAAKKGKKIEHDYRTFFIIGLTWIPLGIATDNNAFTISGIIFMIWGISNKKKWKKQKKWSELSKNERDIKIMLISFIGTILIMGLVFYFLGKKGII